MTRSKSRPRLTEYRLRKWYRLLDLPMTDFDCGQLCAPDNEGVPACCDEDWTVPLLFKEEYRFQRQRSRFWRRLPRRTPAERAVAEELDATHDWACLCPGPAKCERNRRALVCRLYPFMPYVNGRGEVLGMTFMHGDDRKCPLINRPGWRPPAQYIKNSLQYWNEVFEIFPDEREALMEQCRLVSRRYRRLGRPIPLFTGDDE